MSEPTYEPGEIDRRETDVEPQGLSQRQSEGPGQGENSEPSGVPGDQLGDPAARGEDPVVQRQEDEGGQVEPG
ncbi:hypothetical protein C8046_05740 [Serinibacter arcticus]|uniref:Uncharacterized protein n=1 Tax=Serinibacter arcticus TaxID=1655435 RepID=A0A2U1ZTC3_9MICO|nr:hypothetical protein [Serinibacter arcticus]PWD50239.1 hypothetical protein C8046_05740 [Serinibacter arcticus]